MDASLQISARVFRRCFLGFFLLSTLLVALPNRLPAQTSSAAASDPAILHPAEAAKVLPTSVFFRGQSATVEMRNSGGLKFGDGMFVLAALVDSTGYASGLEEKYQGYFITEVPVEVDGHTLHPGAYGVGFVQDNGFVVMDLGAHDLFVARGGHDAKLKPAVPLQILADSAAGHYRLYFGRNYVVLSRAAGK